MTETSAVLRKAASAVLREFTDYSLAQQLTQKAHQIELKHDLNSPYDPARYGKQRYYVKQVEYSECGRYLCVNLKTDYGYKMFLRFNDPDINRSSLIFGLFISLLGLPWITDTDELIGRFIVLETDVGNEYVSAQSDAGIRRILHL